MTKLEKIFTKCKTENRTAFIVFCSCGFPNMETSEKLIEAAIEAGADIIELGVPFSDPVADGPIIQTASHLALKNGVTLKKILDMTELISARHPSTGFVLFSYLNVLLNFGIDPLCKELAKIGIDAILPVDSPFEEKDEVDFFCRKYGLATISLVSPATDEARETKIAKNASGFIYYVSVKGTTGRESVFSDDLKNRVENLQKKSPVPVVVGFGIATPDDVAAVGAFADGTVIGSASIKKVMENSQLGQASVLEQYSSYLNSCFRRTFRNITPR